MEHTPFSSFDCPSSSRNNDPGPDTNQSLRTELNKSSNVATLEPFEPLANCSKDFKKKSKQIMKSSSNVSENLSQIMPGVTYQSSYDKYLTVNYEKSGVSIFNVHRDIIECLGRKPKISFQNDGYLLIEVNSSEESDKLKSILYLGGAPAKCSPHSTLNNSKGLIYAPHLMSYSEETLQNELEDQGVVRVQRMKKKVDGAITPQPGLILTFNSSRLPPSISAAWFNYKVRQYVPRPRRCFHCQEFGHTFTSCRLKAQGKPAICVVCGIEEHGNCNNDPKCMNCGSNHPSSSPKCDVFIFEKEVQATRVTERITFAEAKQKVKSRSIRPGVTFAKVLMNSSSYRKQNIVKTAMHHSNERKNESKRAPLKRTLSKESNDDSPCKVIHAPIETALDVASASANEDTPSTNGELVMDTSSTVESSTDVREVNKSDAGATYSGVVQVEGQHASVEAEPAIMGPSHLEKVTTPLPVTTGNTNEPASAGPSSVIKKEQSKPQRTTKISLKTAAGVTKPNKTKLKIPSFKSLLS